MGTLYIAHYMWGGVLPLLFDRFGVLWAFRDFWYFTDFWDFTIKLGGGVCYAYVFMFHFCSFYLCSIYRGEGLTNLRTYGRLGILR